MNTRRPFPGFAVLLLLAGLVLSGCSTKRPMPVEAPYDSTYAFEDYIESRRIADRSSMTPEERFAYDYRTAAMSRMRDEGVPLSSLHLIERAKTAIGTPYVTGGTGMDGFDCSGFVQWAYRDVGIKLPRTAREQSSAGRPVRSGSLMEGDIVAFSHPKRGYHTGIYIGEGKFIHSPGRGKSVSVAALSDPYFRSTFIGARRVSAPESDAEAVRKLMALDERKTRRPAADVRGTKRSATRKQTAANARGPEARKHAGTNAAKAAPAKGKRPVAVAQAAPGKAAASGTARNAPQTSAKADPKTGKADASGKASAATVRKGGNAQASPAKNAPAKTPVKQSAAKAKGSDKGQARAAPGDTKRKPAPQKADAPRKAAPEKTSAKTARTAPEKAAPAKNAPQTASKAAPKAPAKTNAQPAKTRAAKTEKAAPSKPASAKTGQAAPAKATKGDPKAGKASAAPAKKGGNAQASPAKTAPAKGSPAKQAPAKTPAKQPAAKAAASKTKPAPQAKK